MVYLLQNNLVQVLALILLVIMNFFVWRIVWLEARKLYRNITNRFFAPGVSSRPPLSRKYLQERTYRHHPLRNPVLLQWFCARYTKR